MHRRCASARAAASRITFSLLTAYRLPLTAHVLLLASILSPLSAQQPVNAPGHFLKLAHTYSIVAYDSAVISVPVIRPVSQLTGDRYPQVPTPTKIDELVVQKLRKLGEVPSDVCTDAEFLRRVSLDLTGTLPTAAEVEQFLADPSANRTDLRFQGHYR